MKERIILLFILSLEIAFSLSVNYYFRESKLVLSISGGDSEYSVEIGGKEFKTTGTLVIPWEKGRVEIARIVGMESGETKDVIIKGIHDSPPRIRVSMPEVVGLKEVEISIEAYDDWDKDIEFECFLDGRKSDCHTIDPLPLEGKEHTFEVRAKDSFGNTTVALKEFAFDPIPPGIPKMVFQSPGVVIFPDSPRLEFLMPKLGVVDDVSTLRLDKGYVLREVDDAGNRGEVFVLQPIPSDLSPFSGMAITSIAANTLLIGSKKFSIVGKVLIPEGKVLAVGEDVSVMIAQNAELVVKGRLQGISEGFSVVGGGKLRITGGGEVYMRDSEASVNISSDGGKVVYLDRVKVKGGIFAEDTKFIVLKDMNLTRLECRNCDGVFLKNVSVNEVLIDNTSLVSFEGVEASSAVMSGFVNATLRSSTVLNLSVDTVTRVDAFDSSLGEITLDKGSRLRMRNCKVDRLIVSWFSKVEYHGGSVGEKEVSESEVVEK